ncbi:MAG: ABC transporter permease [Methanocellales archaeon]|nr:ABC transporter permease [Methanocellales archaeon]
MKALQVIYTLWLREMLRFMRSRSRMVGAISMPLMFLIILGPAFGSSLQFRGIPNYLDFLTPGIIGMTILFASMMGGVSIIWDREFGFLKEILVAPVNRFFVALGKAIGGVTTAMIQGVLMMVIAGMMGVQYVSFYGALLSIAVMFLIGLGFIGLGIALASKIESHEGFQMVISFLMLPIFFLSGALFPIEGLPTWLEYLVYVDPLTYGVDALRACLLGTSTFPLTLNLFIITGFAMITISIGAHLFDKTAIS